MKRQSSATTKSRLPGLAAILCFGLCCGLAGCDDEEMSNNPSDVASSDADDSASGTDATGTDAGSGSDGEVGDAEVGDAEVDGLVGDISESDAPEEDVTVDQYGVPPNGWTNAVVDSDIAESVEDSEGTVSPNVAQDTAVLIGEPGGSLTSIVALGPEGYYVVVDLGEGELACDGDGDDVIVLEYGLELGGVPEGYRVSASNAAEGPFDELGGGLGQETFDLGETTNAPYRYIRVESAVSEDDLFGSLGSPLYPGPEIDAVGAFHPCAE